MFDKINPVEQVTKQITEQVSAFDLQDLYKDIKQPPSLKDLNTFASAHPGAALALKGLDKLNINPVDSMLQGFSLDTSSDEADVSTRNKNTKLGDVVGSNPKLAPNEQAEEFEESTTVIMRNLSGLPKEFQTPEMRRKTELAIDRMEHIQHPPGKAPSEMIYPGGIVVGVNDKWKANYETLNTDDQRRLALAMGPVYGGAERVKRIESQPEVWNKMQGLLKDPEDYPKFLDLVQRYNQWESTQVIKKDGSIDPISKFDINKPGVLDEHQQAAMRAANRWERAAKVPEIALSVVTLGFLTGCGETESQEKLREQTEHYEKLENNLNKKFIYDEVKADQLYYQKNGDTKIRQDYSFKQLNDASLALKPGVTWTNEQKLAAANLYNRFAEQEGSLIRAGVDENNNLVTIAHDATPVERQTAVERQTPVDAPKLNYLETPEQRAEINEICKRRGWENRPFGPMKGGPTPEGDGILTAYELIKTMDQHPGLVDKKAADAVIFKYNQGVNRTSNELPTQDAVNFWLSNAEGTRERGYPQVD
ncbi:MAG: hypothetical protein HY986_06785 [Candidatus Melainabacteria bacterium]|nr:hypothetical protein [Candidatus Melainabacteria bacterium]